jgi:cytochrome c
MMRTLIFVLTMALWFAPALAQDVANGKKLFNDPKLGGGTAGKSCNTCHADGADLKKAASRSKFMVFESLYNSLEEVVNTCIVNTMSGKELPADSKEMKDIVAYIKSLKN